MCLNIQASIDEIVGIPIDTIRSGLPAAIMAHHGAAVQALDGDGAYHSHGVGIKYAAHLDDLVSCAPNQYIKAHLTDDGCRVFGITPLAEQALAITGEINAGYRNLRMTTS